MLFGQDGPGPSMKIVTSVVFIRDLNAFLGSSGHSPEAVFVQTPYNLQGKVTTGNSKNLGHKKCFFTGNNSQNQITKEKRLGEKLN